MTNPGFQRYLQTLRDGFDFTKHWNFHFPLVLTGRERRDLKSSLTNYMRTENYRGQPPAAQVRPVTIDLQDGKLKVDYNGWAMGCLDEATTAEWMPAFEALAAADFPSVEGAPKITGVKTRAVIVMGGEDGPAAWVALGDPEVAADRARRGGHRLRQEAAMRAQMTPEEYQANLDMRYSGRPR